MTTEDRFWIANKFSKSTLNGRLNFAYPNCELCFIVSVQWRNSQHRLSHDTNLLENKSVYSITKCYVNVMYMHKNGDMFMWWGNRPSDSTFSLLFSIFQQCYIWFFVYEDYFLKYSKISIIIIHHNSISNSVYLLSQNLTFASMFSWVLVLHYMYNLFLISFASWEHSSILSKIHFQWISSHL